MTGTIVQLHTPLGEEVLDLHAGDHVELSGIVYTARDEAHKRMQDEGIPFNPRGAAIYHCGPGSAGQKNHSRRPDHVCPDERSVRVPA